MRIFAGKWCGRCHGTVAFPPGNQYQSQSQLHKVSCDSKADVQREGNHGDMGVNIQQYRVKRCASDAPTVLLFIKERKTMRYLKNHRLAPHTLCILNSCAPRDLPDVFWPLPPNPPRIKFVRSITGSGDIAGTYCKRRYPPRRQAAICDVCKTQWDPC